MVQRRSSLHCSIAHAVDEEPSLLCSIGANAALAAEPVTSVCSYTQRRRRPPRPVASTISHSATERQRRFARPRQRAPLCALASRAYQLLNLMPYQRFHCALRDIHSEYSAGTDELRAVFWLASAGMLNVHNPNMRFDSVSPALTELDAYFVRPGKPVSKRNS